MAERRPLVIVEGVPSELPDGDTLPGGNAVAVSSETETTGLKVAVVTALPATPDANTIYLVTG